MALLSDAERLSLVSDNRAFDVQMVRSTLACANGIRGIQPFAADPDKAFEWVPGVLLERYRRMTGIGAAKLTPEWSDSDRFKIQWAVEWMLQLIPRWQGERAAGRTPADATSAFEFVNAALREVQMLTLWCVTAAGREEMTVPAIKNAEQCVAYAIACVAANSWDLGGSPKRCPFVPSGDKSHHLWLDYRIDDEGKFKRGTQQEFCCRQHGANYRKRISDQEARAARKHK